MKELLNTMATRHMCCGDETLKCAWSELRCLMSVKYTHFKDFGTKKMWNINNFYVVTFWNDIFDISVQLKYIKIILLGTSLGVHWLRHYASNAGDTDLISGWETKIPTCCLAKKKKNMLISL